MPVGRPKKNANIKITGDRHANPLKTETPAVDAQTENEEMPESDARQTVGVTERPLDPGQPKGQTRASFTINDDGTIAWDRLQARNSGSLKDTIKNDPVVKAMFAKASDVPEYTPKTAGAILDYISGIEIIIVTKALPPTYRIDLPIAAKVLPLSEEEHSEVDPLAAAVLNKHADQLPNWFLKYQDEFLLAQALAKLTAQKYAICRKLQADEQEANAKPNGHAGARAVDRATL